MNIERNRDLARRAEIHAALANHTRLRIVDLLSVSDLAASELSAALGVPSNLLAHHLKVLEQSGLLHRRRSEGDARRSYFSLDRARPVPGSGPASVPELEDLGAVVRVLFVCTANTARSHLAAALWRQASDIAAASAGTHPGAVINPLAQQAAQRHGLTLPNVTPRGLDAAAADGQLLITVCDRAHEELGRQGWAHWSIPDPVVHATPAAFDAAYDALAARVQELAPRLALAS